MKCLVIVDMQNDFIDGSLANPEAKKIVPGICDLIKNFDGNIILTRDTHYYNYLNTLEGKRLPIEHCIYGSSGWAINTDIINAYLKCSAPHLVSFIDKETFGMDVTDWYDKFADNYIDSIEIVGTCTDICVISNALILKASYPEIPITVYSNLCAGTSKEAHEAALTVMKNCQIEIKEWRNNE